LLPKQPKSCAKDLSADKKMGSENPSSSLKDSSDNNQLLSNDIQVLSKQTINSSKIIVRRKKDKSREKMIPFKLPKIPGSMDQTEKNLLLFKQLNNSSESLLNCAKDSVVDKKMATEHPKDPTDNNQLLLKDIQLMSQQTINSSKDKSDNNLFLCKLCRWKRFPEDEMRAHIIKEHFYEVNKVKDQPKLI
jgi:hypothetical protein